MLCMILYTTDIKEKNDKNAILLSSVMWVGHVYFSTVIGGGSSKFVPLQGSGYVF